MPADLLETHFPRVNANVCTPWVNFNNDAAPPLSLKIGAGQISTPAETTSLAFSRHQPHQPRRARLRPTSFYFPTPYGGVGRVKRRHGCFFFSSSPPFSSLPPTPVSDPASAFRYNPSPTRGPVSGAPSADWQALEVVNCFSPAFSQRACSLTHSDRYITEGQ